MAVRPARCWVPSSWACPKRSAAASRSIAAGLAAAFEAGLAKLRAQTPAKPGDKTMVDALVPAVEAMRQAADAGAEPAALLAQAAEAAQRGAEKHPRASGPFRPRPEPRPADDRPRRSRRHLDRPVVRRGSATG